MGLKVSEEIRELFDETISAGFCRDRCILSIFKAKRAIYYAKKSLQANRKAWTLVHQIYPETTTGIWRYDHVTGSVERKE